MTPKRKPINKKRFLREIKNLVVLAFSQNQKGGFGSELKKQHILILLQGNESNGNWINPQWLDSEAYYYIMNWKIKQRKERDCEKIGKP